MSTKTIYPITIGRLTLLREEKVWETSRLRVHCIGVCQCGKGVSIRKDRIFSGNTSSCGSCGYQQERVAEANRTHGLSGTPEYDVYMGMIDRCYNENRASYENYRDIAICDRWLGSNGAANFCEDMGPRPSLKYTIERIDNDGDYEPDNCKWATRKEQNRNFGRNRNITYHDRTQCLSAWIEELGVDRNRFYWLLRKGYADAEALSILEQELQAKESGA